MTYKTINIFLEYPTTTNAQLHFSFEIISPEYILSLQEYFAYLYIPDGSIYSKDEKKHQIIRTKTFNG